MSLSDSLIIIARSLQKCKSFFHLFSFFPTAANSGAIPHRTKTCKIAKRIAFLYIMPTSCLRSAQMICPLPRRYIAAPRRKVFLRFYCLPCTHSATNELQWIETSLALIKMHVPYRIEVGSSFSSHAETASNCGAAFWQRRAAAFWDTAFLQADEEAD